MTYVKIDTGRQLQPKHIRDAERSILENFCFASIADRSCQAEVIIEAVWGSFDLLQLQLVSWVKKLQIFHCHPFPEADMEACLCKHQEREREEVEAAGLASQGYHLMKETVLGLAVWLAFTRQP